MVEKKVPSVAAAVLWSESEWAGASRGERRCLKMCYQAVEASLDIEAMICQTSCFSETIVMNIPLSNCQVSTD